MRVALGLVLALCVACGSEQTTLSEASSTPSPVPSSTPTPEMVTVRDASSGSTVRLRKGQQLRVRLSQNSYAPPVSSDEEIVVRRSIAGGYPSDQPVDAVFQAVAAGSAEVSATSDAACFHTEPRCLMAVQQWTVHVIVTVP